MASARDLKTIRRGCHNRDIRAAITAALANGARYKMTRKGVMIYGDGDAAVVAHFTVSDRRGALNLMAQLKKMGHIR
jgi:hypothetical protein